MCGYNCSGVRPGFILNHHTSSARNDGTNLATSTARLGLRVNRLRALGLLLLSTTHPYAINHGCSSGTQLTKRFTHIFFAFQISHHLRRCLSCAQFFKWLSTKYPKIVVDCVEHRATYTDDGTRVPVDSSQPNPNGVEYDNLFLDMNGIIHPASHPEDRPPPETEDDMYIAITDYLERVFNAVRPRKLLFMAVDGVAPRAKMNQQRSRRFRSAQEAPLTPTSSRPAPPSWTASPTTCASSCTRRSRRTPAGPTSR